MLALYTTNDEGASHRVKTPERYIVISTPTARPDRRTIKIRGLPLFRLLIGNEGERGQHRIERAALGTFLSSSGHIASNLSGVFLLLCALPVKAPQVPWLAGHKAASPLDWQAHQLKREQLNAVMASEKNPFESGLAAVEAALAYGGKLYDTAQDFNLALDHIAGLLEDAIALFERGSFATAAFLAITALEETGKAHVAVFRRDKAGPPSKGRDPLRDHQAKHLRCWRRSS